MCKVSDKIKFCTCSTDVDVEELDYFWTLYRQNLNKEVQMIGLFIPPDILEINFDVNESTIEEVLNSDDAFDKPMEFQKNDIFELILDSKNEGLESVNQYTFAFSGKTWKPKVPEPFELENKYDEVCGGYPENIKGTPDE